MPETPPSSPLRFRPEPFETHSEDWNEYELADGVRVRVKTVVTGISRGLDPNGHPVTTPEGSPVVRAYHTTLVAARFAEKSDA